MELKNVESIEGIFLANVYDRAVIEMKNRLSSLNPHSDKIVSLEDYKQTRISFNNGDNWVTIPPPTHYYNGRKIYCEDVDECRLNLFINPAKDIEGLIAPKTAIGLVVAHGSIGPHLTRENVALFVSQDGGLKFKHVAQGSYKVAIGNFGSLITAVDTIHPTRILHFSVDHGETWVNMDFMKNRGPLIVKSMYADKHNLGTLKFIISGDRQTRGGLVSTIIELDFSVFKTRPCLHIQDPQNKKSDFEYFQPMSNKQTHCILGKRSTYVRKKANHFCFVNQTEGYRVS